MRTISIPRITFPFVVAACFFAAAPAVAAPEFTAYYGKDTVREGTGGEMKHVEGLEFWANGAPPRRYELVGYIQDRRLKTGIVGAIRMSGLEKAVAAEARKAGADAVILVGSADETVAVMGLGSATASGNTAWGASSMAPMQKHESRFAVVRYVAADTDQ